MNMLFALDPKTDEIIVSDSPKGSKSINLVERIKRTDNPLLHQAVQTLTLITTAPTLDAKLYKAMDRVCQMIYKNHAGHK
jgi:hypothetical protein